MGCNYFTGLVPTRIFSVSSQCLILNKCVLCLLTSSISNGGAIFVSDVTKSVSIIDSSFVNCSAPGNYGGAACIFSLKCEITRICGVFCSASSCQFMQLSSLGSNILDFNNSIYYLCPPAHTSNHVSIMLGQESSSITFNNNNSTKNSLAGHAPGVHINHPISISSSYVTISNCSGQYIIILNGGNGVNSLSYYNILHNTPSSSLFYCYKTYTISHSSILFNSNNNVHYPSTGSLPFLSCNTNPLVSATFLQHEYPNGCPLTYGQETMKQYLKISGIHLYCFSLFLLLLP